MVVHRIGCINFCGLGLPWIQSHLLNDMRSLSVNVAAISEYSSQRTSSSFSIDTRCFFISLCQPRWNGSGTVVLFRKDLHLKIKAIFFDLEGKSVVLYGSSSNGGAFILVTAYALTEAGRSDCFKRLEDLPRTFLTLMLAGDHFDCRGAFDRRGGAKAPQTCSDVFKCLTGTD